MVGEEKWHLVPSYEDATILIRNYETNTVTKFSCFSSNKDFVRIGIHLITIIFYICSCILHCTFQNFLFRGPCKPAETCMCVAVLNIHA